MLGSSAWGVPSSYCFLMAEGTKNLIGTQELISRHVPSLMFCASQASQLEELRIRSTEGMDLTNGTTFQNPESTSISLD